MSDLISRSELIEEINELLKSPYANKQQFGAERRDAIEIVRDLCVKRQPTAYSVDKVVEELEERTDFLKDCTKYGNKNAKQQAKSYSTMMMYEVADLVDDLLEIVKQGGVSDDVCEKMQMQAYNKAVDNCLKILYFHQNEYDGIQWAIREIEELKEMESD